MHARRPRRLRLCTRQGEGDLYGRRKTSLVLTVFQVVESSVSSVCVLPANSSGVFAQREEEGSGVCMPETVPLCLLFISLRSSLAPLFLTGFKCPLGLRRQICLCLVGRFSSFSHATRTFLLLWPSICGVCKALVPDRGLTQRQENTGQGYTWSSAVDALSLSTCVSVGQVLVQRIHAYL